MSVCKCVDNPGLYDCERQLCMERFTRLRRDLATTRAERDRYKAALELILSNDADGAEDGEPQTLEGEIADRALNPDANGDGP